MKELQHFYIHSLILALVSSEEVLGVCVFRHTDLDCGNTVRQREKPAGFMCICHLLTERDMHSLYA